MSLSLTKWLATSQPWLDCVAERAQPVVRELIGRRPWLKDTLDGTSTLATPACCTG